MLSIAENDRRLSILFIFPLWLSVPSVLKSEKLNTEDTKSHRGALRKSAGE
jgi:hypothetical protein